MAETSAARSDHSAVRGAASGAVVAVPARRWPRALALLTAAVGLAIAAGAFWWAIQRPAPVHYVTTPVARGTVSRAVTATGTVNPVLTIIVGSYVSGVIQDQYCDFNTRVHKGQLCAKIDPRPYQTVVNQARADLANARAQIVKDRAQLAYASLSYRRDGELVKRGIVSQDAADNAKNVYDQARAQIQVDEAAIQQKSAALESAQVNLEYTNIVSPVDGTVVSRNVTIGQTVAASFQTPTLFLIATDLTRMEVDANVSESDVGDLRAGQKVTFTVEAFPDRPFEGAVVQVRQAPQTVQNIVTYDVVVGVPNRDLLLKPGMTATTRIVTAEHDNVLRVPDQALRFTPSNVPRAAANASAGSAASHAQHAGAAARRVWVLRDGAPVAVEIETGLDDDSYAEVTRGALRTGDLVIVGEERDATGDARTTAAAPRLHA